MQQKKNDFRFFLERTNELAHKLRIPLRELGAVMSMSTASLFGYRAGKIPLSNKAWGKLEAAERAAGLGHVTHDKASGNHVTHDVIPEKLLTREELSPPEKPVTRDELAEMGAKIDRLTDLVEQLLEQRAASARQAEATSSSSRGSSSREKTKTTTPKKLA